MDASSTRHPSCSRIGIRILTIILPARARRVTGGRGGDGTAGAEPRSTAGISQPRCAGAEERARRGSRGAWRVFSVPFLVVDGVVGRGSCLPIVGGGAPAETLDVRIGGALRVRQA